MGFSLAVAEWNPVSDFAGKALIKTMPTYIRYCSDRAVHYAAQHRRIAPKCLFLAFCVRQLVAVHSKKKEKLIKFETSEL